MPDAAKKYKGRKNKLLAFAHQLFDSLFLFLLTKIRLNAHPPGFAHLTADIGPNPSGFSPWSGVLTHQQSGCFCRPGAYGLHFLPVGCPHQQYSN